ncbi:hypothetical protein BCR43DRAFT_485657 [Syncephalastrum racemosum]|uniref:Uncharacterized protein n=1 Tax=Syncephalastrum racemosum TaxID=13706 RepID=A0A1X2HMW4_SYNRA|nr:hypothetical protein BCR43DRAFT_485657 [Syncephalastrum racemosum]
MGSASVERVNRRGSAHSIISETSTGVSQYATMPSRNDQRPSAALATLAHGSQDASYSSSTMRTADRNRQTSPNNMASSRSSFFAHNEQDASLNSPSRPRNAHATSSVASPVSRIRSVDHATMPSTTAHEATATSNDKASSSLSSMHQDGPASSNPRRVRTSSTSVVPSAMTSEMDNSMAHFSTSIKKRSTDMHTLQKLSFDELEELLERIQLEKNIVRDLGVKLDIQRDEVMLAMWEKNRQQDAEEFQRYITEKRRRILEREQQLHI